jgi:hypothetical protein
MCITVNRVLMTNNYHISFPFNYYSGLQTMFWNSERLYRYNPVSGLTQVRPSVEIFLDTRENAVQ